MASVAQSSGGGGGGGGGTGFLFGNIDRRGRLEEDYLDDDAKDAIDNVAPTVTDRDQDLAEITKALPGRGGPAGDDDDDDYDDDDEAPASANDNRVDYYNEEEELRDDGIDDEAQRARMAQIALEQSATKKSVEDDDENYDEDGDDDAPPAPKSVIPTPMQVDITPSAPAASSPSAPTVSATPSVSALLKSAEASREDEQRRLMEEARKGRDAVAQRIANVDDSELPPLRFSKVFTKPVEKIDMRKAKPRTFGVRVADDSPNIATVDDDTVLLDTPPPEPKSDPVSYFLAKDRLIIAQAEAEQRAASEARGGISSKTDSIMLDAGAMVEASDDDDEASKPLDANSDPLPLAKVAETAHVPVQQIAWEDDINWGDDEEDCEDSQEEDDAMVVDSGQNEGAKSSAPLDSDSDDDEWEDVQTADAPKPSPPPAPLRSAPNAFQVPLSKPLTGNGHQGRNKPAPSQPAIPLSKPLRSSNSQPHIPSIPQSKPLAGKASPASKPPAGPSKASAAASKGKQDSVMKDKKVSFAKDLPSANEEENAKASKDGNGTKHTEPQIPILERPTSDFISQVLRPNRNLVDGSWVEDVIWDSGSSDVEPGTRNLAGRFSKLILDMNDPNMIFEQLSDSSGEGKKSVVDPDVQTRSSAPKPPQSSRLPLSDPFNISNDIYYSSGSTSNQLKVDRRSLLRGLHNAPPAVKCQTTRSVPSEESLLSWHRPKIPKDFITEEPVELLPFRRRRPKGGSAQIAGQIPKKRSELFCSSKDAYRVTLVEYALEKQPCIMPVPGTASRILTYSRKKSSAAAAQALKNAAGTPEADTVFLAPEQPPPLHAGDIEIDGPSLSVMESHIFAAPCVRAEVPTTDFLVVRRGSKMHVREIDSVVSLGVTEPKVEVMAPNTDRFKKYAKDRVSLYLIREFMKQQKKEYPEHVPRPVPALDKESIFREFSRRRTYPETSLIKMLKELARYQNGRYTLIAEPAKGFSARESELLRTVTAEETAAFEAMESGWETLINYGIRIFTHPTSQGNIIQAGERTGLEAGPAVGSFVKNQLLQSPWYRSQTIMAAQRVQKKEMLLTLSLARIVNDLREGGDVMENRLLSLSAGDLQKVLSNHFRILPRKVPDDIEERRQLVREYTVKRSKGSEPMDYPTIIKNVIAKHRAQSQRSGGGSSAPHSQGSSGAIVLPLEMQRAALEKGIVDKLPTELERTHAGEVNEAASVPMSSDDAFGKKRTLPNQHSRANIHNRGSSNKRAKLSKKPPPLSAAKPPRNKQEADDQAELQKLAKSSAVAGGPKLVSKAKPPKPNTPARSVQNDPAAKHVQEITPAVGSKRKVVTAKRPTRLKLTKKEIGPDGVKRSVVTYVTDPDEIEQLLSKQEAKQDSAKQKGGDKKSDKGGSSGGGESGATGGERKVKIAIGLHKLSQGGKAGVKKKASSSSDRKKSSKKPESAGNEVDEITKASSSVRKVEGKGHIGKIRISTKQMKKEKEEAAQKRLKNQYAEEDDFRARKSSKGVTSRKKRNGAIQLNSILEKVEKAVRSTEGYVAAMNPMKIARLRPGERPPDGISASNLATPSGTALDFTQPVDVRKVPKYKEIVKKPMDLGRMREKCKKMTYQSARAFLDDMNQIVENARAFNSSSDVQWVVQHAELLQEVAIEQVTDKSDDIQSAEDAIAQQNAEIKAPAQEPKKKKRKKGSSSKKSGDADGNGTRKKQKTGRNGSARTADERPPAEGELQPLSSGRGNGSGSSLGKSSLSGGRLPPVKIPLSKPSSSRPPPG